MTHAPEHEALLQRLLTGGRAAEREDTDVLLGGCPDCRAELARLRAAEQHVVRLADGMNADWREARAQADEGDRERMRASLLRTVRMRNRRRWMLVALAAGLLLVAGIAWLEFRGAAPEVQEYMLSNGKIRLVAPLGDGATEAYGPFVWERELPPRTHFLLSFYRCEGSKRGSQLHTIIRREPRWTPTPEEEQALPSPLVWRVDLIDETTDASLEFAETRAQR